MYGRDQQQVHVHRDGLRRDLATLRRELLTRLVLAWVSVAQVAAVPATAEAAPARVLYLL